MPEGPSYNDLINGITMLVQSIDDNAKREADKLSEDITLLRGELNDTRRDMTLMREEMNTLRVDMTDMRGSLKHDMIKSDSDQCKEIELIKQEAKIKGDRKAQVVGVIVTATGLLSALVAKIFGLI